MVIYLALSGLLWFYAVLVIIRICEVTISREADSDIRRSSYHPYYRGRRHNPQQDDRPDMRSHHQP